MKLPRLTATHDYIGINEHGECVAICVLESAARGRSGGEADMKRKSPIKAAAIGFTRTAWAIQWRSQNKGALAEWLGRGNIQGPEALSGCPLMLFSSRKKASAFIKENYGYVVPANDLHGEAYLPMPIKVTMEVRAA